MSLVCQMCVDEERGPTMLTVAGFTSRKQLPVLVCAHHDAGAPSYELWREFQATGTK